MGSLTRRPHAQEQWAAPEQWEGSRASMTHRLLPPTPPQHTGLGQDLGAEGFMVRSAVPMRIWAPALALLCSALPLAMARSPLGLSPQGAVETCTNTSAPGSSHPHCCESVPFLN